MTTITETDQYQKYCEFIDDMFVRRKITLPVLPEVAGKVVALANSDHVNNSEMVALLHKDSVIAGHVLKVANSPVYGSDHKITSLLEASQLLGTKLLSELTVSISLKSNVFLVKGFKEMMHEIWHLSICTALWAKDIAAITKSSKETLYVSGLLHSIGMAVVLQTIAIIDYNHNFECDQEMANNLVSRYHTAFTKYVMRVWELPEPIKIICSCYLDPDKCKDHKTEAAALNIAGKLAYWTMNDEPSLEKLSKDPVLLGLKIDPKNWKKLTSRKERILEKVSSVKV